MKCSICGKEMKGYFVMSIKNKDGSKIKRSLPMCADCIKKYKSNSKKIKWGEWEDVEE